MKTLRVEFEYWERSQTGKFYFLDEEGAGIDLIPVSVAAKPSTVRLSPTLLLAR